MKHLGWSHALLRHDCAHCPFCWNWSCIEDKTTAQRHPCPHSGKSTRQALNNKLRDRAYLTYLSEIFLDIFIGARQPYASSRYAWKALFVLDRQWYNRSIGRHHYWHVLLQYGVWRGLPEEMQIHKKDTAIDLLPTSACWPWSSDPSLQRLNKMADIVYFNLFLSSIVLSPEYMHF